MFTLPERLFALRVMKYKHVYSPEVTFTTSIMKYQHVRPPRASLCYTCNEILTFSLFGGAWQAPQMGVSALLDHKRYAHSHLYYEQPWHSHQQLNLGEWMSLQEPF